MDSSLYESLPINTLSIRTASAADLNQKHLRSMNRPASAAQFNNLMKQQKIQPKNINQNHPMSSKLYKSQSPQLELSLKPVQLYDSLGIPQNYTSRSSASKKNQSNFSNLFINNEQNPNNSASDLQDKKANAQKKTDNEKKSNKSRISSARRIFKSKETLVDTINTLKIEMNTLKDKNLKQITTITQLQTDNGKMQKIFKNLDQYVKVQKSNFIQQPQKSFAYLELKNQINKLKGENYKLKNDYNELKKSQLETNIQELKTENRTFQENLIKQQNQCAILQKRIQLQDLQLRQVKQPFDQQKLFNLNNTINTLEKENQKLQSLLKLLEDTNESQTSKREAYDKFNEVLKKQLSELQSQLFERDNQISKQNELISQLRYQKQQLLLSQQQNVNIEKLMNDQNLNLHDEEQTQLNLKIQQLQQKLENEKRDNLLKEQFIRSLENQIQEIKHKSKKKEDIIYEENCNMKKILDNYKDELQNLQIRFDTMICNQTKVNSMQELQLVQVESDNKNIIQKRVLPIKKDQVNLIGFKINYNCRIKQITIDDLINNHLFTQQELANQVVVLDALKERLFKEPFNIESEEQAMLLSRYLIEDNEQDFVEVNLQNSSNIIMVQSRFRNLIGEIITYSESQQKQLIKKLDTLLKSYRANIQAQIYLYPEYKEKNIVTREIIQKIVEYEEIPLSKQELDFWYLKLYELSHQINSFSMDDVLYTFRAYEQQQFQEIQQLQIPQNPVSHQNQ